MPLTGAERARRFREKLKKDPEKYERYKQKQRDLVGKQRKKIADLNDNEKKKQREQWRQQKRNQKERKKASINKETIPINTFEKQRIRRSKKLQRLCYRYYIAQQKLLKLSTVNKRLTKQLARSKQKSKDLEIAKSKTAEELENLKDAVKETYADCKSLEEKRLLKKVAFKVSKKSGSNLLKLPKILGLKTRIRFFNRRNENERMLKVRESIAAFYLRDDVSRCAAGRKECKTRNKQKMQVRYLLDTLLNTYRMYREEGGKISFSTFYRYRPYYVIAPTRAARDTCMCIKHSNFEYLFTALKLRSIISYKNIDEVLKYFSCDITSFNCMHGHCELCKTPRLKFDENQSNDSIRWHQWVRIDHKYQKGGKEYVTKKTTKQEQVGTIAELTSIFQAKIILFKIHFYNWKEQHRQYRKCVQNLKSNEIAILCDFSENYECKYTNEVQSIHFGASKKSITLHTGAIFFEDKCQTFATVSDNNSHSPEAIWAHLLPIIKYAKDHYPEISIIHFFSDGPTCQYRQKKNFFLLNFFTCKLKLDYSTWSFSESGHGKSVADGVGGSVKRQLDKRVSYGCDITDATEAYNVLLNAMKSVKCFYVNDTDLKNIAKLIPSNITPVPRTMKLHQIISDYENTIKYRLLSCFCGDKPGLCDCLSPKIHKLVPDKKPIPSKTESNKDVVLCSERLIKSSVEKIYPNESAICSQADLQDLPILIAVPSESEYALPSPSLSFDFTTEQIDLNNLSFDFDINFNNMGNSCDSPVVSTPKCVKKRVRVKYPGDSPPPPRKACARSLLYNDRSSNKLNKNNIVICNLCQKDVKCKIKCMVCKSDICLKCSGTNCFDYICPPCFGVSDDE